MCCKQFAESKLASWGHPYIRIAHAMRSAWVYRLIATCKVVTKYQTLYNIPNAYREYQKEKRKRVKKPLALLGWREWISLPDLGVDKISAKVDTGAHTSSLYATHIKVFERDGKEFAKFRVTYGKPGKRKFSTAEAPLVSGFEKLKVQLR